MRTVKWKQNTRYKVWQWNLFYSKVIARSVNTFIPLRDETINSSLVERGRSLMDPQPHPLLHFLVRMKPTSTNVFIQVAKNVEVTRGKDLGRTEDVVVFPSQISEAYPSSDWQYGDGSYVSCKRMIPPDIIPGCFDLQPPRNEPHLSVLLCLSPFPMLDEHTLLYAHLHSNT